MWHNLRDTWLPPGPHAVRTLRQPRAREPRALCPLCPRRPREQRPQPRSLAAGLPLATAALACSRGSQDRLFSSGDPPTPTPGRPGALGDISASRTCAQTLASALASGPLVPALPGSSWSGRLQRDPGGGGPVTHLPPGLIFHTGRGLGVFQRTSSPPAPLPPSPPGCGLGGVPGSPAFPAWGHTDTLWLPPSLHRQKTGFQRRGWLRSGNGLQVTGWNEGLLTPDRWWS